MRPQFQCGADRCDAASSIRPSSLADVPAHSRPDGIAQVNPAPATGGILARQGRCIAWSNVFWTRLIVSAFATYTLFFCASAFALTAQTIAFSVLASKTYGTAPFTITATASSGLPVSLASLTLPVCTVSATTVTIVAAG